MQIGPLSPRKWPPPPPRATSQVSAMSRFPLSALLSAGVRHSSWGPLFPLSHVRAARPDKKWVKRQPDSRIAGVAVALAWSQCRWLPIREPTVSERDRHGEQVNQESENRLVASLGLCRVPVRLLVIRLLDSCSRSRHDWQRFCRNGDRPCSDRFPSLLRRWLPTFSTPLSRPPLSGRQGPKQQESRTWPAKAPSATIEKK
jgi:hypothetical protein